MQQSVDRQELGSGIVGEFYSNEPKRTRGKILISSNQSLNIVGRAVIQSPDEGEQVGVGESGIFAGILINPKSLVRQSLDHSDAVTNGARIEVAQQGYLFVDLPTAASIGDFVYYDEDTGELNAFAPDDVPSSEWLRVPGGTVEIDHVTAGGSAVIYLDTAGDRTVPEAP
ncbi:conserved hypothetical protein [Vibrio chagasii]|nr:conserved hypothetical protein [Vibrio chagasii]